VLMFVSAIFSMSLIHLYCVLLSFVVIRYCAKR